MASDPEALSQLARLLQDERFRSASAAEAKGLLGGNLDRLADGLIAEAAASDDVTGQASAIAFVTDRLDFLGALINSDQRSRLLEAVREKIAAW